MPLLTWPCVNWVSWAMVSFTCPCWGRGAGEGEDCRFALGAPEVIPFCPGAEETVLAVEIAVETGCPLMIWVTTCWGAPTQTAKHYECLYAPRQYLELQYHSTRQVNALFSVFKKTHVMPSAQGYAQTYPCPDFHLFSLSSLTAIPHFLLSAGDWKNNILPVRLKLK